MAADPQIYCQNINFFKSIFDAAAIGQYLGGGDPRNGTHGPGFINESCIFNPSLLVYEWLEDLEGRKVPFAVYGGEKFRVNNLHIHSKNLWQFTSKTFKCSKKRHQTGGKRQKQVAVFQEKNKTPTF